MKHYLLLLLIALPAYAQESIDSSEWEDYAAKIRAPAYSCSCSTNNGTATFPMSIADLGTDKCDSFEGKPIVTRRDGEVTEVSVAFLCAPLVRGRMALRNRGEIMSDTPQLLQQRLDEIESRLNKLSAPQPEPQVIYKEAAPRTPIPLMDEERRKSLERQELKPIGH